MKDKTLRIIPLGGLGEVGKNMTVYEYKNQMLIVDAGIGRPSDAAQAMELGLDGVLLNTAVAQAIDPVRMARAFRQGIKAGRLAFEAGVMAKQDMAVASTPVAGYPILL